MKITIDFDKCLELPRIQDLAKILISDGHDVYILTSRFDAVRRLKFNDLKSNEDLYRIAKEVGIEPFKIAFTNQQKKWIWLLETGVEIHLDDNKTEVRDMNYYKHTKAFDIMDQNFEEKLFEYIEAVKNF